MYACVRVCACQNIVFYATVTNTSSDLFDASIDSSLIDTLPSLCLLLLLLFRRSTDNGLTSL